MENRLGVTLFLVAVLCPMVAWSLPDELAYLETLVGDETALLDAARRFDTQQKSLIAWDQKLMNDYEAAGQRDLALSKQSDLRHRIDVLAELWDWVYERYPNNARANNYFGEYLYDYQGEQGRALQMWKTAAQIDRKLAAPHNNLGIHYFHAGDYRQGLKQLQRSLELDKENPDFLYNMSQMYLIHFPELQTLLNKPREKLYRDAMDMSRKAAELAPDDFDIVQDYAVNFYAGKNFGVEVDWVDAARAWQQAQALARTDAERYYSLLNEGRAWLQTSKKERAVAPLETAVELRGSNDVVARLLEQARQSPG